MLSAYHLLFREKSSSKAVLFFGGIILLVSSSVIIGWLFNIRGLLSLIPNAATMKFNTALLFLFSGISLIIINKQDQAVQILSQVFSTLLVVISTITLVQYILHIDLYIDNLFVFDPYSEIFPGRMSPATATCFLLTGLCLMWRSSYFSELKKTATVCLSTIATLAFVAFIAYILQIPASSKIFFFNSMAIHTSLLFLAIALAISLQSPYSEYLNFLINDYAGSRVVRLLLPLVIILPLSLSYILLHLYSQNIIEKDFGVVLYTTVFILLSIAYVVFIGVKLNASDKKRRVVENILTQTNKELASFKDALDQSTIVAITDKKGVINYVNDKFCEIAKYSRDELIGSTHSIIKSGYHPKSFFKDMWNTIGHGEVWAGEIKNKAKDGRYYWVQTSIVPFRDKNGNIYKHLSIRQDITKRKEAEELLATQYSILESQNKELEQFAYIASHDLQEPLRTITSITQLLDEDCKGKISEFTDQYLDYLMEASGRMSLLITSLLDYSRIGKNKQLTTVDCNLLLNNVKKDLGSLIEESKAIINFEKLPSINGYETELRLLFQNLITNAIKFRKKETTPLIVITAFEENDFWIFACQDNGIGIAEEYQERIFIIFQRLHTRNEYTGSGIGLAHCKKIVELHGGKIWVESQPNQGSTFFFSITNKINQTI